MLPADRRRRSGATAAPRCSTAAAVAMTRPSLVILTAMVLVVVAAASRDAALRAARGTEVTGVVSAYLAPRRFRPTRLSTSSSAAAAAGGGWGAPILRRTVLSVGGAVGGSSAGAGEFSAAAAAGRTPLASGSMALMRLGGSGAAGRGDGRKRPLSLEMQLSDLYRRGKLRIEEVNSLQCLVRSLAVEEGCCGGIDGGGNGNEEARFLSSPLVPLLREAIHAYSRQSWRRTVSGLPSPDNPAAVVLEWIRRNGGGEALDGVRVTAMQVSGNGADSVGLDLHVDILAMNSMVSNGAAVLNGTSFADSGAIGSIKSLIRSLVERGEIFPNELSEECVGALQNVSFELAQKSVREYVLQKRKRQEIEEKGGKQGLDVIGLGPIRNPSRYIMAILRGMVREHSETLSAISSLDLTDGENHELAVTMASSTSFADTSDAPILGNVTAKVAATNESEKAGGACSSTACCRKSDFPSGNGSEVAGTARFQSASAKYGANTSNANGRHETTGPDHSNGFVCQVEEELLMDKASSEAKQANERNIPVEGQNSLPVEPLPHSPNDTVDWDVVEKCISLLRRLEEPVTSLRGVGPKTADALSRLGLTTVRSLLWHFPTSFIDRTRIYTDASLAMSREGGDSVSESGGGAVTTLVVTIESIRQFPFILRIDARDDAGNQVALLHFHSCTVRGRHAAAAAKRMAGAPGCRRIVSGKLRRASDGGFEIPNPDVVKPEEDLDEVQRIEPVYKLVKGINNKKMSCAVDEALRIGGELLESIPESLPEPLLQELSWPSLAEALIQAHRPLQKVEVSGVNSPSRRRLAFEELCIQQAQLALTRWRYKNLYNGDNTAPAAASIPNPPQSWDDCPLVSAALAALPFQLTESQKDCLTEVWKDSVAAVSDDGRISRMARLLQGDVGSGKTVLAYLLGLGCFESPALGNVAAILAPTTLLAQQHYRTFAKFVDNLNQNGSLSSSRITKIHVELVTGSVTGQKREAVLKRLERCGENEAFFLMGTHALLTSDVTVQLSELQHQSSARGLALTVVDEEQRFGVRQRDILARCAAHVLYMSATPIPRTLVLGGSSSATVRTGSMDLTFLRGKPESARRVKTSIVDVKRVDEIILGIHDQISVGNKVFWILPEIGKDDYEDVEGDQDAKNLTEEVLKNEVQSVKSRFETLSAFVGNERVGMVHGRMSVSEREEVFANFASPVSQLGILVGTTVLEVGIDIPDINILIVENAEHFGLSQLHQLRGRIGRAGSIRNDSECHCVLLTDVFDQSEKAKSMRRLDVLRETDNGAQVAQKDLSLRGPGEVLGLKQTGMKNGHTVDLAAHWGMIAAASHVGRCFVEGQGHGESCLEVENLPQVTIMADDECLQEAVRSLKADLFFAEAGARTPSGLALRVCLFLFGNWRSSTEEGNTGHALLTLHQTLSRAETYGSDDVAVEKAFSSLANSFSEGTVVFDDSLFSTQTEVAVNSTASSRTAEYDISTRGLHPKEPTDSAGDMKPSGLSYPQKAVAKSDNQTDTLFLLLDVETTGLSPKSSHITQLAAKFLGDNEVFSQYILPPVPLSSKIEELTGITNEFLNHGGLDAGSGCHVEGPAPDFGLAYDSFCGFMNRKSKGRPVCLVAHNAAFDIRMLNVEVKRLASSVRRNERNGMRIPNFPADTGIVSSVDTLVMLRNKKVWSSQSDLPPSFGLQDIYFHVYKERFDMEHNAVGDVNALEEILLSSLLHGWEDLAKQLQSPFISLPEND